MRSKNILWITLMALLFATTLATNITVSAPTPTLYLDPDLVTQTSGYFTVAVKVANVSSAESLYAWEARITFNPGLLEVVKRSHMTEGPFIPDACDPPNYESWFLKSRDNFLGVVSLGGLITPNDTLPTPYPPVGATGDGTLAYIKFHIKGAGLSPLDVEYSALYTVIGTNPVEISHDAIGGVFDSRTSNADPVADFDVSPSPPVTEGELLTFDGSLTVDDGWIVSYEWDFGYDIALTDKWTGDNATKTFVTSEKPVIPGSEGVYVNGSLMTKPADYTIDYETGTITFTTAPEKSVRIEVPYTAHPQASGMTVFHTFPDEGTYNVTLTVTDNDGATDSGDHLVQVLVWMEEGPSPDLIGWEAKPEKPKWWETLDGQLAPFNAKVGNPTSQDVEVYVEFTLHSKDQGVVLGTIETTPEPLAAGTTLEQTALLDITDNTWACLSGSPEWIPYGYYGGGGMRKYAVFARCFYNDGTGYKVGDVVKYFHFNVLPAYHDIGVVMWAGADTVPENGTLDIYANITNYGSLSETFVVDVTYKGELEQGIVEQRSVTVAAGTTVTETFPWDTTGLPLGIYIIKVTLPVLTYEYPRDTTDQEDLTLVTIV